MSELPDFQKKQLLQNPNLEKVTEDQVLFTPDFKRELVEAYLAGSHPEDFFIEANINLDYFPEHFAQSCLKRWLKKYRELGRDAFKEDGRMCRGKLNTRGILAKLALSKSSFYKKKNVQDEKDFEEVKVIKKYYDLSSGKSGIRQLKMEIEIGEGLIINRKKIARLKNKFNLVTAIRKALYKLSPQQRRKLLLHSDQCVHFTHESFRKILRKHKVTQSMSSKGNCYDNAPIESFFGHFKDLLDVKECKTISDLEKEVMKKLSDQIVTFTNYKRSQLGLKRCPR